MPAHSYAFFKHRPHSSHLVGSLIFLILPVACLIALSWFAHFSPQTLFLDLAHSFYRIIISYLIALVIAWTLAVLLYKGRAGAIALPILDVLQSFPTFAALPLATYAWGVSDKTIIFFLVITIIWPLLFSILSTLKLMRHDWTEAVNIYHVSGRAFFTRFLFPASLPGVITGSVIGLGEGWEALIATEMIVGAQSGLGIFFQLNSHNSSVTAFGIIAFLILIFCINKLIWIPLLDWSHHLMEE